MAIREIRLLGDPVLRKPGVQVTDFDGDLEALVEDMFTTMYHSRGIGLAAPQVGVSQRVLVIDLGEADEDGTGAFALVNPRIVSLARKTDRAPEGCLSIPGLEEVVERPASVVVEAVNPQGEPVVMEASGLLSRAIQHEMDHLDGVLFIDRVSPLKRRMLLRKWQKSQAEEVAS